MTSPTQAPAPVLSPPPPTAAIKIEPVDNSSIDFEMNGMPPQSQSQSQHQQNNNVSAPPTVAATATAAPTNGRGNRRVGTAAVAPAPPQTRKDRNLCEFLDMMEEHAPIVRVPPPPTTAETLTHSHRSPMP